MSFYPCPVGAFVLSGGVGTMRPIAKLICDERAATAVEYGLILSLIVIAIVAGVTQLGSKTSNNWNNVANEVSKG